MGKFLVRLGSTFFFTGHFPIAPATFASLITLAIWWLLPPMPALVTLGLILAVAALGVPLATRAEAMYGHDGKPIVIDEVVGALLTVAWLGHSFRLAIVGFLLFRVLDVLKPPPAYQLQALRAGWGIMADDIMAAIYGNLLLRLVSHLRPGLLTGG